MVAVKKSTPQIEKNSLLDGRLSLQVLKDFFVNHHLIIQKHCLGIFPFNSVVIYKACFEKLHLLKLISLLTNVQTWKTRIILLAKMVSLVVLMILHLLWSMRVHQSLGVVSLDINLSVLRLSGAKVVMVNISGIAAVKIPVRPPHAVVWFMFILKKIFVLILELLEEPRSGILLTKSVLW